MGITDRIGSLANQVQEGVKSSSSFIVVFSLRLFTGLLLGLTLALASQEIMKFGDFAFLLVLVTTTALFLRLSNKWGLASVLVFDLVCFLVAMLFRMYLLMAP